MAQGYMRQLRAHSGQCGRREADVCFPAENMWQLHSHSDSLGVGEKVLCFPGENCG